MRRLLLTPRWLVRHVIAVALVITFLRLGWWQWTRAESGNVLSYGYTFEWPLFALFVMFMWWKMLHFERRPPTPEEARRRREPVPKKARRPPAPPAPAPSADEEPDEELDAYNRYLAALAEGDRPKSD